MDSAGVMSGLAMDSVAAATAASSHASTSPSASASVLSPMSADVDSSNNFSSQGLPTQTQTVKRRSAVACRRCRRMRSKCVHVKGNPPCKACQEAGIPAEQCIFPVRGQPDLDRDYRHPRTRTEKTSKSRNAAKRSHSVTDESSPVPHHRLADDWTDLPPIEELIEGVGMFFKQYFQLGFIPRKQYIHRLRHETRSTSLFLLTSILGVSARLSPLLRLRYGSGLMAAEYFTERATAISIEEIYEPPTLERCQAFYLLSIAQSSSERNKSYINMGIAVRLAVLLQLQLEETYQIPNLSHEHIVHAESARRTIWTLHSHDNLHSGTSSPASLPACDITTLLPCSEEDFSNGRVPRSRASLEGTPPAIDNPKSTRDPNRSLFATLMQVRGWWGLVGRRAIRYQKSPKPWDSGSEFAQTARMLREWEQDLPHEHLWSTFLFKGYKSESQELAYVCVTLMTRLSNIILRRPYLVDIIKPDRKDTTKHAFYRSMSDELFASVFGLYEQVDALFTNRSADESIGAHTAAFCVYTCGLFSTYLCKYSDICRDKTLVRSGPIMVQRSMSILKERQKVWSLASRWLEALGKLSLNLVPAAYAHDGTSDDGRDPMARAGRQLPPLFPSFFSSTRMASLPPPSHPNLPEVNVLPRLGVQPEPLPPASSIGSPLGNNNFAKSHTGTMVDGVHHLPSPPQQQAYTHRASGKSPQAYPSPHHTSQQPYAPLPINHNLYPSPQSLHQAGRYEVDGAGLVMESYDSPQMASQYGATPYVPPLEPGTDGFENELQFYLNGPTLHSANAIPWLTTLQ